MTAIDEFAEILMALTREFGGARYWLIAEWQGGVNPDYAAQGRSAASMPRSRSRPRSSWPPGQSATGDALFAGCAVSQCHELPANPVASPREDSGELPSLASTCLGTRRDLNQEHGAQEHGSGARPPVGKARPHILPSCSRPANTANGYGLSPRVPGLLLGMTTA